MHVPVQLRHIRSSLRVASKEIPHLASQSGGNVCALANASSMSFDVDTDGGGADEFCHINSAFLRTWELRNRERDEQRLRLREFVGLTEPSIPGLPRFVEVFRTTGSWEETATLLGRERCECIRRSLRQLAMRMG